MDDSISISKDVLASLEGHGFHETVLGDRMGSIRQYRNKNGVHVREYQEKFVIHQDRIDPTVDPIGHLLKDAPETLFAFGTTLFISSRFNKNRSISSKSPVSFNPLFFLLTFLSLNRVFRRIKKFLL